MRVYGTRCALFPGVNAPSALTSPSIEVVFEDVQEAIARATKITKRLAKPKRWPVLLCGLVAMVAGLVAFTSSPLAADPRVKPHLDAAVSQLVTVVDRYL